MTTAGKFFIIVPAKATYSSWLRRTLVRLLMQHHFISLKHAAGTIRNHIRLSVSPVKVKQLAF